MGTQGPSEPPKFVSILIRNELIKQAFDKVIGLPMKDQSGNTNYKIGMLRVMRHLDTSEFLESEKELALINLLEIVSTSKLQEIAEHRSEFVSLLNELNSIREANAKAVQKSAPKKGILKDAQSKRKDYKVQFDMQRNTEATFIIEKGRKISYSTEEFKQGERDKYRAKRTPNEAGEVQLKSYGLNPPLSKKSPLYQGRRMPEKCLKELVDFFESVEDVETVNITLKEDGTYQIQAFTSDSNRPTNINYDMEEMYQLLFGYRFQKHLSEVLTGYQRRVDFFYHGKENYAVIECESPVEDELNAMLAAILALDIKLEDDDIEVENNRYKIYLKYNDIRNALIDHPMLSEDVKEYYQQALEMAAEEAKEPDDSESSELSNEEHSDSSAADPGQASKSEEDEPAQRKPSSNR